jgi:hypothetical protein
LPQPVAIAEQLLHPPVPLPLMHNLYCESRAIEFIGEAFQAVTRSASDPASPTLRPNDHRSRRQGSTLASTTRPECHIAASTFRNLDWNRTYLCNAAGSRRDPHQKARPGCFEADEQRSIISRARMHFLSIRRLFYFRKTREIAINTRNLNHSLKTF